MVSRILFQPNSFCLQCGLPVSFYWVSSTPPHVSHSTPRSNQITTYSYRVHMASKLLVHRESNMKSMCGLPVSFYRVSSTPPHVSHSTPRSNQITTYSYRVHMASKLLVHRESNMYSMCGLPVSFYRVSSTPPHVSHSTPRSNQITTYSYRVHMASKLLVHRESNMNSMCGLPVSFYRVSSTPPHVSHSTPRSNQITTYSYRVHMASKLLVHRESNMNSMCGLPVSFYRVSSTPPHVSHSTPRSNQITTYSYRVHMASKLLVHRESNMNSMCGLPVSFYCVSSTRRMCLIPLQDHTSTPRSYLITTYRYRVHMASKLLVHRESNMNSMCGLLVRDICQLHLLTYINCLAFTQSAYIHCYNHRITFVRMNVFHIQSTLLVHQSYFMFSISSIMC